MLQRWFDGPKAVHFYSLGMFVLALVWYSLKLEYSLSNIIMILNYEHPQSSGDTPSKRMARFLADDALMWASDGLLVSCLLFVSTLY